MSIDSGRPNPQMLFITQEFVMRGGAGVYACELVKAMASHGVEIHVMSLGRETKTEQIAPNVTVHWHRAIHLPLVKVPMHHLQVLFRSRRLIKKYGITSIHSNNNAAAYAPKTLPMVATIHHPAFDEAKHATGLQRLIYQADRYFEWRIRRRAAKIIVPSHLVHDLLTARMPSDKVSIVPNGIDTSFFKPVKADQIRVKHHLTSDDLLIFFPGGARSKRKGALDFITSLQKAAPKNFTCIVTGETVRDAGWNREMMTALEGSGLKDHFIFLDEIDFDELPAYYSAADIVVYPSTFEGFGFPALEALACARPLVCTDTGEMPYFVHDGKNGFIVPVGDVKRLSEAILLLLENPTLRASISKRARDSIASYSWKNVSASVIEVHEALLHPQRGKV